MGTPEEKIKIIQDPSTNVEIKKKLLLEVIEQYIPLVHQILKRFNYDSAIYEDLVQEAKLCIINSVYRYDSSKSKFITFLYTQLLGAIQKYIYRDHDIYVPITRIKKNNGIYKQEVDDIIYTEEQDDFTMEDEIKNIMPRLSQLEQNIVNCMFDFSHGIFRSKRVCYIIFGRSVYTVLNKIRRWLNE
ncbi:MAG: sigma factor [Conexivisphaerales archaeon]